MITKYRTNYGDNGIEKVEVLRETAKMVVLPPDKRYRRSKERREFKASMDVCYFDTWEAAHQYLEEKANRRLQNARMNLERAKVTYGQIKGLKP